MVLVICLLLPLISRSIRPDARSSTHGTPPLPSSNERQPRPARTLTGHAKQVTYLAFSPDGDTLISGSKDRTIRTLDVRSGESRSSMSVDKGVKHAALSPDGKLMAWVGLEVLDPDLVIRVLDTTTWKQLRSLSRHTLPVRCLAFGPDGKTLASGGWDKTIRLWDVGEGREARMLEVPTDPVFAISFSRDGKSLFSGGIEQPRRIRVWDAGTGAQVRLITDGDIHPRISAIALSPNGIRQGAMTCRCDTNNA
ncbi:MAG: hypothetical protein HYY17_03240 [Planctomycetes bacterium]|nr:hypothetical protein [Planctomycetota bacterium]